MTQDFTMERLLSEFGGLFRKYIGKDAEGIRQEFSDRKNEQDLPDYINDLFHECLSSNEGLTKAEVLEKDRQVYLGMARYSLSYKKENPNPYIRLAFEAEFLYYRLRESKEAQTFAAQVMAEDDSCALGKKLAGMCGPVREIQKEHPLAGEDCSRSEGCVCAYSFEPYTASCCAGKASVE